MHYDLEVNYRRTDVPDLDGEENTRLRLDRASYHWGGTRFRKDRREVGRFLQSGMIEFGLGTARNLAGSSHQ